MPLPPGAPGAPSHWLVYFGIDDLDGAAEGDRFAGGTVMVPPQEVPGGRILVARDPQGAVFALFARPFRRLMAHPNHELIERFYAAVRTRRR